MESHEASMNDCEFYGAVLFGWILGVLPVLYAFWRYR